MRKEMLKKIKKQLKKRNMKLTELCPYCELKATIEIWTDSTAPLFGIEDVYCNKGYESDVTTVRSLNGECETGYCNGCKLSGPNGVCYSISKIK